MFAVGGDHKTWRMELGVLRGRETGYDGQILGMTEKKAPRLPQVFSKLLLPHFFHAFRQRLAAFVILCGRCLNIGLYQKTSAL